MTPSLLLALGLAAQGVPPVSPREVRVFEGRNRHEARLRDLYGEVRVRLAHAVTLEDGAGPWLLLRYQVRNARSRVAEVGPEMVQVRLPDGTWLAAEGISEAPPLAAYPRRPSLSARQPVRIPRDQTWPLYASFRTEEPPERVDPAVVLAGRPVFLLHPVRAPLEELAEEALRHVEEERLALAEGLLTEAARAGTKERLALGTILLARARELRTIDRPVLEDRVLRLALPYAPNPSFVQARLAELRRRARSRDRTTSWGPPPRDWGYHERRAEQFRVDPAPRRTRRRGDP